MRLAVLIVALLALMRPVQAAQYYVATCGADSNTGASQACGSASGPWRTSGHATSAIAGGDHVTYLPNTYATAYDTINLSAGGSSHATRTVFDCSTPMGCFIAGGNYEAVYILAAHVQIGGDGSNGALYGFDLVALANGGSAPAVAICLSQVPSSCPTTAPIYDILVIGNRVHDSPGGGIELEMTDYLTISKNIIYNNAHGYWNQASGISIANGYTPPGGYSPASDLATWPYRGAWHNIISGNIVYNNFACVQPAVPNQAATWSAATAYSVGRGVYAGDANVGISGADPYIYYWVALASNTNSAPSTVNPNWARQPSPSTWNAAATYTAGQQVYWPDSNGRNYPWQAAASNSNSAPSSSNTAAWTKLTGATATETGAACPAASSDGNGIILDTNKGGMTTSGQAIVLSFGPTVIENNVVWGNGGRGIHALLTDYVTIRNNTIYDDMLDPDEASGVYEVGSQQSSNITIVNNLVQATVTPLLWNTAHTLQVPQAVLSFSGINTAQAVNLSYENNYLVPAGAGPLTSITFAAGVVAGTHNVNSSPGFVAALGAQTGAMTIAQAAAAFTPAAASARASAITIYSPAFDVLGTTRPLTWEYAVGGIGAGHVDRGAVQVTH